MFAQPNSLVRDKFVNGGIANAHMTYTQLEPIEFVERALALTSVICEEDIPYVSNNGTKEELALSIATAIDLLYAVAEAIDIEDEVDDCRKEIFDRFGAYSNRYLLTSIYRNSPNDGGK